jgi:5'-nucleotidase
VPTNTEHPLILVTNDDGIDSPGLLAAVEAVMPLGEPFIVAPDRQWSGAARSMPQGPDGRIFQRRLEANGQSIPAYQVDASPALTVLHALLELAPRRPALLVSGINYGENVGIDITISGTVGAALEGAVNGLPALAVSLQTPKETHLNLSDEVDFSTARHFTRLFARRLLTTTMPFDVDVLKLDVPSDATPETPWRLTRLARHTHFAPVPPQRDDLTEPTFIDYEQITNPECTHPDSDIHALAVDRVVAVTPLSLDLTSRVDRGQLEEILRSPRGF